ncbi:MAG: hypothetical protein CMA31_07125 [Euryarchaeota archaeon]|nr:hypothetical protein [Euryarchaeota archaeon]RPG72220.1 MAG: hypothetical protein CBD52_003045 [Euryarchaeota archaeon TMED192]
MGSRSFESTPEWADQLCIILVRPYHEGNIGAVARCMMNFGITDLRIVGRDEEFTEIARKRAKHANSILEETSFHDDLKSSTSDLSLVIGTSGKRELGDKTQHRHFLLPEEMPSRVKEDTGKIGIVFGPEGKGLLNHELRECEILVTIPTWEGYPIMNLSHAVAVICYSWFINSESGGSYEGLRVISPGLRRRFREEVGRLSQLAPTQNHRRKSIEDTLIRVIMRGLPKEEEISRILSVITSAADAFEEGTPHESE